MVTTTATAPAATLRIGSVSNFRTVGGTVYRSAKLSTISAADKAKLAAAGITDIIDLRTPAVAKGSPDPAIKGATHHAVNVYAVYRTPAAPSRSVAAAKSHMRGLYRGFVAKPAQRAKIAEALTLVANADGPVLIHCTEGKDRTGWLAALMQLNAGASSKQVLSEYLKSNSYRAAAIKKAPTAAKRALLKVEAGYLNAGLSELKKRYGGLDGYLRDGLGLSTATIEALRAKLSA